MQQVIGMPDLHPGKDAPIGAVFLSVSRLYPTLVGNDIGCGMALHQTSLKAKRNMAARIKRCLMGLPDLQKTASRPIDAFSDMREKADILNAQFDAALGTIGGGNHFAEFQQIETLYDTQQAHSLGIDAHRLLLLVHSGSRGYGEHILRMHTETYQHQGVPASSPEGSQYLEAQQDALKWARLNRHLIAQRMLDALGANGTQLLDVHHNFVEKIDDAPHSGWLHRKGATPSTEGIVVIPGSRGDYSYLVCPTPSPESLWTLAHGAGRKWKRSDCKGKLSNRFKANDLKNTVFNSEIICEDKGLLYEEAPQAYKGCDAVVQTLVETGLVTLIARLKPVLTYKTAGNCSQ